MNQLQVEEKVFTSEDASIGNKMEKQHKNTYCKELIVIIIVIVYPPTAVMLEWIKELISTAYITIHNINNIIL